MADSQWLERNVDSPNFDDRVRDALLGFDAVRGGRLMMPSDEVAQEWEDHAGEEAADKLAAAVSRLVTDEDVKVRSAAIRFFQRAHQAPDDGALRAALADDGGRFDGVRDPLPGASSDLRGELARAAVQRLGMGDRDGLDVFRRELLRPGGAGPVLAAMWARDQAWVLANAPEILRSSPQACDTLIWQMSKAKMDLRGLLTSLAGGDLTERLRSAILDSYPDGPERLTYLAMI